MALAALLLIGSCGGGGGGGTTADTPELFDLAAAPTILGLDAGGGDGGGDAGGDAGAGGAAGDGSPIAGATVFLTDSAGKVVSGKTDSKGGYLLRFKSAEFKPPFVLRVVDAGGNVLASVNEITVPAGKATRININPLTDKVVSDVLPAAAGGTDKDVTGASVNVGNLAQAKANLRASVQAALGVAGVADAAQFDPVRSAYNYDGNGVDAVIESVSHARTPATGATELRAKLAPLVTNADGTVVPTLISASTPLATSQVAIASNAALTFSKITNWINRINGCLAISPRETAECSDAAFEKLVSPGYKHNSRSFDEDFRTLCSEAGGACVNGATFSNPSILFIGKASAASAVEDAAVVEVTIRQPRSGPLAGNLNTPLEYTKNLVFRRDDATPGLLAGNWILVGNQRSFDWSVEPSYEHMIQTNTERAANTNSGDPSRVTSGIRAFFNTAAYDAGSRTYVSKNIFAVRLKGPGLPAAGLVYAPNGTLGMRILNRTGDIPTPGTQSTLASRSFRMGGVILGSGDVPQQWPASNASYADTPGSTDYSKLGAYNVYTAEFFVTGSATPIVETTRILAPIQGPAQVARQPLHDLTPSLPLITPPVAASSTVTVQWRRTPGAVKRIDNAYVNFFANGARTLVGGNPPDALAAEPNSTSVALTNGAAGFPSAIASDYREVGLEGRSARAYFLQSLIRTP